MTSPIRSRVAILALGISLLAAAVGAKLVHLQVLRADDKRAQAHRQHTQTIEIDGQRGAILDREGREFAVSVTTFSLYAHPHQVKNSALEAMGPFKRDDLSIAAIAKHIPTAQKIVDRVGWR